MDGGGTASYVYDAEGRRVQKTRGGVITNYIYDLAGSVMAEFGGCVSCWNVGYIYLNGQLTAEYSNSTTYFVHKDHLGSTRLLTTVAGGVSDSLDYLPYGEQIAGDTGTTHKFTGKERDAESGLDNFGARYNSSSLGRFMSPDSTGYSSLANPQAWNLYAYTLNNPLKYNDPSGHTVECATNAQQCKNALAAATANAEAAKRVTANTVTTNHSFLGIHWTTSKTAIGITGDINSFKALGQNASRLADLVQSKQNFTFAVSPTYETFGGATWQTPGGIAQTPSQGYSLPSGVTGAATAAPNSSQFDQDTWGLLGGYQGPIPGANLGEAAAHELLGHMWGEVFGGHLAGTAANMADAVRAEDAVRATDPTRGQKVTHGGEQVIPTPRP